MKGYLFILSAWLFVSLDVGAQKVPVMETGGQPMRDEWETTRDATYVFLPVTFDKNGRPTIEWRDEWRLEDYK